MGHGVTTRGTEGKAGGGMDEEEGPSRWARFGSGFASGVASANQQQPSAAGSSVNAASQIAASMLQRQQAKQDDEEGAQMGADKLPAWYVLQRQREEEAKIRAQMTPTRLQPSTAL